MKYGNIVMQANIHYLSAAFFLHDYHDYKPLQVDELLWRQTVTIKTQAMTISVITKKKT